MRECRARHARPRALPPVTLYAAPTVAKVDADDSIVAFYEQSNSAS
jgi:hypothetical protein